MTMTPADIEDWIVMHQSSTDWEQDDRMHLIDLMNRAEFLSGGLGLGFIASIELHDAPLLRVHNWLIRSHGGVGDLQVDLKKEARSMCAILYLRRVKRLGGGFTIMFDSDFDLRDEYRDWRRGFCKLYDGYFEHVDGGIQLKQSSRGGYPNRKLVGDDGGRTAYMNLMSHGKPVMDRNLLYPEAPYEPDDVEWLDAHASRHRHSWVWRLRQMRNTAGIRGGFGLFDKVLDNMSVAIAASRKINPEMSLRYANVTNVPRLLERDLSQGDLSFLGAFYVALWALVWEPPEVDIRVKGSTILGEPFSNDNWGRLFSSFAYQMYPGFCAAYGDPEDE